MESIAVVSLLNGSAKDRVLLLWDYLEEKYSTREVRLFEYPHISFQGGHTCNKALLKEDIYRTTESFPPFTIEVDGIGYFDTPKKVIFLKVKKSDSLTAVHNIINAILQRSCSDVYEYYTPEKWIPHISLAIGDISDEAFEKAKADLSKMDLRFKAELDNIQLVKEYYEEAQRKIVIDEGWSLD